MKLRKMIAGILAFALVITASPIENVTFASTEGTVNEFEATENVLMSSTVGTKTESSADIVYCANQGYRTSYQPGIATLKYDILKNIDTWYTTWNWFAYRIDVEADGTYGIGVKLQGIKNTKYVMPVCVDNELYKTAFTDTAKKELTVEVDLSEGSHLIVFFMPMPENSSSDIYNAYPWTNVDSLLLADGVSVMDISEGSGNEITEAEVKASLYTRVEAGDETYVSFDLMESGGYSPSNNKSQAQGVSRGKITQTLSELVGDNGELNYLNKTGLPYVQYVVDAPEDGEYYINVGYQFNGTFTEGMDATAFAVIANDKVYTVEQTATASSAWLNQTLAVELKAGRNIIRTTGLIKDTAWWNASAWMNHDYLAIESGVDFVEQSTTSKNAGDETIILKNNYTDNGDTLGSAVTGNIRTDKPTIEQLEYSGNRISRWPFASVKVEAEKDGYYDITFSIELDAGTATSSQIGILVNGTAYSAPFKLADASTIDASVYLKKGTNVITFTIPMPEDSSGITGINNADYPWANMKTIAFGTGITEFSKPSLKEIRSYLYSTLHSGDETQVFINKFKTDNGNSLANPNTDYMKNLETGSRVSMENLVEHLWSKGFDKIPYVAYEMSVEEEGDYEVIATIKTRGSDLASPQLAVVVDRAELYKATIDTSGNIQKVGTKVHLTAGTHTIMITSPMPETNEAADNITAPSTDSYASMNKHYPWCDVYELYIGKGVELGNIITANEVDVEAENTEYVAGGTVQTLPGTSANTVVESTVNASAELEERLKTDAEGNLLQMDWAQLSYLEFATTGNAGNHEVSLDVIANCASENESDTKPKVCIYVNGTIYEKTLSAWNTIETITINADLVQGTNVFKCFAVADEVKAGTRVFFDTIECADTLTVVKTADVTATETTIEMGDENTVFTNKYTDNGDTIGGAKRTDVQSNKCYIDGLNTNLLTYVPYAALKVSAENTGYYDIRLLVGPNNDANVTSDHVAILVDGKAYPLSYKLGVSETTISGTVYMEKGTHMLIFTSPMPVDKATAEATNGSDGYAYPWFNMKTLTLSDGLSIVEKPGYDDVDLSEVIDAVDTIIDAGDEAYVLENKYTDAGTTLESANANDLKNNRVSLETLLEKGFDKAPYASFNVTAAADGTYELYAVVTTDAKLTSEQIAVIVDRMTVLDAKVEKKADKQIIRVNVELTKGTHNIIFTSPMPLTDEEAQAIPDGNSDGWAGMNGAYHWMNYIRFGIDKDLTLVGGIEEDLSTGLEAEDSEYVKYYGDFHAQVYPNASEGNAVTGKDTVNNMSQLDKNALCYNWGKFAYIEFAVDAASAGAQDVTFHVIATNDAKNTTVAAPKLLVYVNGEWKEVSLSKGWNTFEEVTVSLNLAEGVNIIKCFAMSEESIKGARMVFDYIEYDTTALTAVKVAEFDAAKTVIMAGDEENVFINLLDDKGDYLAASNANRGHMQYRKLYIDGLKMSQLTHVPYAALKVTAEKDGYYDISVSAGPDTTASADSIAMLIDGKAYALTYKKTATTTLYSTVYLEKGTHMLIFTTPMPVDSQTAAATDGADKSAYPWFDMKSISLDAGLSIVEKPGYGDVDFSEVIGSVDTIIDAGDETLVLENKYTDNDTKLDSANTNDLKSNRVSVETLLEKGFDKAPFATFNIMAQKAGTYELYALVATDATLNSEQVAVIVDRMTVVDATVEKTADQQIICVEVQLTKGTHNIIFTSPMPLTDKEAQAIPDGDSDGWAGMNGAYRWMNYIRFGIDKDLTVVGGIEDDLSTGLEAEDSTYVKYYGDYHAQVYPNASEGNAVSGKDTVGTIGELDKDAACYDWNKFTCIEFGVDAKKAGVQKITFNVMATNAATSFKTATPKLLVNVNGEWAEVTLTKGWNTFEEVTISVNLAKGKNVIKCFAMTDTEVTGARVVFDYIEYDTSVLTAVKAADFTTGSTTYNAGDETVILSNHYTDNGDTLGSASCGDMQWRKLYVDGLNTSVLTYVPYAAMKVSAEADGFYEIGMTASANAKAASKHIALMVDGKAYALSFPSKSSVALSASVYLTKGTHILVFTSPMPVDSQTAETTEKFDKSAYPWFDMKTITLGKGLKITEKATTTEVELSEASKLEGTIVNAGDEAIVLPNRYTDNGDTLGGANTDELKSKRVSVETLLVKGFDKTPFASFNVTAKKAGTYDIYALVETDAKLTSKQIAVIVDTKTVKSAPIEAAAGTQIVHVEVKLSKGTHNIIFTSPMPFTDKEAKAIPNGADDNWAGMNGAYRWMNITSFVVDQELTVEKGIKDSKTKGQEAADSKNIKYAGGYKEVVFPGASSGTAVGGDDVINLSSQLPEDVTCYNWGQMSYIEFAVKAKSAGTQKISVRVIATDANASGDLPKVVIYVNGKLYEQELTKGWNEFEEITIPVEVAKGENVIRVFTVAEEKTEGSRVLFDYIEYDETELSQVTVERVQESQTIINAGDEKKVLFNHYTDNGETLGNASLGDLQWDKLSLDVLTYDNLSRIPYAAIKVTAAKTGYYDVALGVSGYNRNTESTQIGLYVDGTTVYVLGFEKVANPEIHASVYLTKGTHTLVFTTPMPADKKTAAKTEKFDKLAYPWMDMSTIILGKGLKVAKRPTAEEIEAPFYDRIEAENGDYVLYNNYESTPEANSSASGGYVIGGQMRWLFEQTYEDMKVWLDAPHNSYVEYAVTAPADGEYKIRVGFLAGTKDESVKKPFIAVFANNEVQKAKFTKNWGEIDTVELTVNLKKGLNIIRCTSITTEQECFDASTWINHDFLEIEKRLTAEKRSSVKVEAEDSNYINKIKVQDGSENEKASGNKVLGSMDRNYVSSLKMTLDSFTTEQLKMVPYFSYTVAAPRDGYYSVSVNMAGDGRLKRSTIGLLVDGQKNAMYYSRNGQSTESTRADILVYLKKGEHILTFTAPMPVDKNVEATYSYYWMNYDYVTLHDGLELAKKQKAPTDIADYVRVEAEEYAMLNLNRNTGSVIGGAYYRVAQSLADILQNGIDGKATAYAEFNIQASEAGTYTLYLLTAHGMTNASTVDEITENIVVEHNGDMQTKKLECVKGSSRSTYVPITLKLEKGKNTIRITHSTADSLTGDGLAWVDFNYFEMSADVAQKLKFVPISNILEAEDSLFTGYAVDQNESYSQKQYVGSADYGYVDENDVTFENLVPDALEDMPAVTYTFEAEKAGTYTVSIGFAAGMYKYTTEEMAEGATGGIAVIVNEKEKQLVEFDLTSSSAYMTRLVTVDLEEGENTITVTTTLADYFHGHTPRIEDEYRLIWVDHDYLLLSDGLSTGKELDKYGLEDSDYNFAQIVLKAFTGNDTNDGDTEDGGWLPIVIGLIAVVGVAGGIVVFLGKKKKSKAVEK